ncbi:hypothetical protein GCM10029978_024480 [Actinoallomurus acanthiterrae]
MNPRVSPDAGKPALTWCPAHTTSSTRGRKVTFRAPGTHEASAEPGPGTRFRTTDGQVAHHRAALAPLRRSWRHPRGVRRRPPSPDPGTAPQCAKHRDNTTVKRPLRVRNPASIVWGTAVPSSPQQSN